MANITDPTAIAFVNELLRPWSDRITGTVVSMEAEWPLWNDVVGPIFAAEPDSDLVIDGAADDGRVILTVGDVETAMFHYDRFVQLINGQFNADTPSGTDVPSVRTVYTKPHVNLIGP